MIYPMLMDLGGKFVFIPGTTGTNTYTATIDGFMEYRIGQPLLVKFTTENTGASSLNINGLGAKTIVRNGNAALISSDIRANSIHQLVFDGMNFQLQTNTYNSVTANQLTANRTFSLAGAVTGSASTNLAGNVSIATSLAGGIIGTVKRVQSGTHSMTATSYTGSINIPISAVTSYTDASKFFLQIMTNSANAVGTISGISGEKVSLIIITGWSLTSSTNLLITYASAISMTVNVLSGAFTWQLWEIY